MEKQKKSYRRKPKRNIFTLPPDSEEFLLLEEQARKDLETYRKSKDEVSDVLKKEALDDKDFLKQVISMLGQILERMSKLEMNQEEQAKQLNELNKKLKALS
ncbi:hypothetical protein [Lysinibacillus sp. NPDC093688]|uniref:hypothetical protein n=1 Tax=Lysinibacillus sp. NPDC093688 TaxID=3390577 RepID=UPI003D040B26